jgi:hypothetical protein
MHISTVKLSDLLYGFHPDAILQYSKVALVLVPSSMIGDWSVS